MPSFNIKVILLAALFAALVIKGGQLCSADGVQAMTRLVEPARSQSMESGPPRSFQEEFRGISPLPDLAERASPSRKFVKPQAKQNARKPVKAQPQTATKPAPAKPAGKS